MADVAFKTVGDFNKQFENCSGFKPYTKKNSNYFVINEELSEMFSSSGAGSVDLTGYDNKKFTTSFPAWVNNFICSIKFNITSYPKIKCIENTHVQHTTTSNTIYGCFPVVIDKNDKSWSMQFAFKENISVGTEIDFSSHINAIKNANYSYYNTQAIILNNAEDFIYLGGDLCLYKDKPNENLFLSMHEEYPVL